MPAPLSSQMRVGRRVAMTVFWTMILVVGTGLALLVGVTQIADLVQSGAGWSTGARTGVVAAAVAMVLSGLWGIAASYRNLRHSVDLITEVDRARTEAMSLESTRYMQRLK